MRNVDYFVIDNFKIQKIGKDLKIPSKGIFELRGEFILKLLKLKKKRNTF